MIKIDWGIYCVDSSADKTRFHFTRINMIVDSMLLEFSFSQSISSEMYFLFFKNMKRAIDSYT